MIPRRLAITGFLSFLDCQELFFDGATVWLFTGPNGAGKSAVFDAITFALFGHHRGGNLHAADLIHKSANEANIEFEFELENHRYQIRRTLRRNPRGAVTGTQQVIRRIANDEWEPIPETAKRTEFEHWVRHQLGHSYESFTTSVLLLQGRAEKLLDARPHGRAEILAAIVGLDRYERIHETAEQRRLAAKAGLDALSHHVGALPAVSDVEAAATETAVQTAIQNRELARRHVDSTIEEEAQSRRWTEADARLATARNKFAEAEAVLADSTGIEKQFARWQELRAVLPAAKAVVAMQTRVLDSRRRTERLLKDRERERERKRLAEAEQNEALEHRAELERRRTAWESRREELNRESLGLRGQLEAVKFHDQQQEDAVRIAAKLGKFPPHPDAAVRTLQAEVEQLMVAARAVPLLERLVGERAELQAAHAAQSTAQAEHQRIRTEGSAVRKACDRLAPDLSEVICVKAFVNDELVLATNRAEQSRATFEELTTLRDASTCRTCGQPLTVEHFALEHSARETALIAAEEELVRASERYESTAQAAEELSRRDGELKNELARLREAYRVATDRLQRAEEAVRRITATLTMTLAEANAAGASEVDLEALKAEVTGLDAARQSLERAKTTAATVARLSSRGEAVQQTLERLCVGLPPEGPSGVRRRFDELHVEEAAVVADLAAVRKTLAEIELQADKLGHDAHAAMLALADRASQLNAEELTRRHCDETADRALAELPADWRFAVQGANPDDSAEWASEAERLAEAGAEARFVRLGEFRSRLVELQNGLQQREAEADEFPPLIRRTADAARREVLRARAELEAAEWDLRNAEQTRHALDYRRTQRAHLSEDYRRREAEFHKYQTLAELLGKDHLQRQLAHEAELAIVEAANVVLEGLGDGQLTLALDHHRSFNLECNVSAVAGPVPVAFLSGSQRFRIALALALGLGRFSRPGRAPIETLIIDEGFSSLDPPGRIAMVHELAKLSTILKCIIVVSHEPEFAESIPNGYRFEFVDGRTVVNRTRPNVSP